MKNKVIILIAEDDRGHAELIKINLHNSGITNEMLHFRDGQEILDFLQIKGSGAHRDPKKSYLILLDIRMPKVSGMEVLQRLKDDPILKKIPVIIITTTDNPREIIKCHELGCNNYITKPVDYEKFINAIEQLGLFLMVVEVP